jgi:hypothetical protein
VLAWFDAKSGLMHQAVMFPAQQHQVIHRSFTAISPVLDVVGIDKTAAAAAREAAATVTALQSPPDGRRNGAALTSDI